MNKKKGDLYEIQIRDYIINELNNPAYLWKDTPETILIENGIIGSHNSNRLIRKENKINPVRDTGVDVIQIENNKCSLVQCKNGYGKGLRMEDLAGFNAWISALDTLKGYVYYTNKLSSNITSLPKNKRIEYIKQPFKEIKEQISAKVIKPYDYQIIAVNKFKEYFQKNNRGILAMPCGTGKTLTSYLISREFKQIIILSPLKEFAKQNLNRYVEYGYNGNVLLVSSDGCRDIKEINKFISLNKSFLISSTFCSIDCISQILDKCDNPLIIIDEFHNLSKTNIIDEKDDFYKVLNSDHKIMFMSATPRVYELEDEMIDAEYIFGEIFYKMSFNEAIEKKFITDYKIWLPSIHEDNSQLDKELSIYEIDYVIKAKCIFFFSCLLNNGSKKCIIYCKDTNEIDDMMKAMDKLNEFYCLDINTSKITAINTEKERSELLVNFKNGNEIQLLFSVRILDECIDIPSCDSIFITYPTKSKIRTIQRMSRCMRINKFNSFKVGNIFIWCDEYDKILETLSGIKEYDVFFKDKIKVNSNGFFVDGVKKNSEVDNKLVEKYIVGIKEFKMIGWEEKLEMVKKYINENEKRPSSEAKDNDIKMMGRWLLTQQRNYKLKKEIMKNLEIYNIWTEFITCEKYKKYFISNEEEWNNKLAELKKYIDKYNKRPSIEDKDIKISHQWINIQQRNYKSKKEIMKNSEIYNKWTEFITSEKYKKYFISNEEEWQCSLNLVKKYIDENDKTPSQSNENKEIKTLSQWMSRQNSNYKSKKEIMKNSEIYDIWTEFITSEKYEKYLISDEEKWNNNLEYVRLYIDENNKRPDAHSKNKEISYYGNWLLNQSKNYKSKEQIMKNPKIYDIWTKFINSEKYKKYFISNEEEWQSSLNLVKKYIDENDKRPSSKSNNKEISYYGNWLLNQSKNYKSKEHNMKNPDIYDKWTEFITSEKYKKYFMSNKEEWQSNLSLVKKYIDENDKRPSCSDKIKEIKILGEWVGTQYTNYKLNEFIMKNHNIYDIWVEFVTSDKYKKYFISNEEKWENNFDKVKKFIDENEKKPSTKNKDTKTLGLWVYTQQQNYKLKKEIMSVPYIHHKWGEFITNEKYKKYFLSNEEEWLINLNNIKKYIDKNDEAPSCGEKDEHIKKLTSWLQHQKHNYKFKENIMKNPEIYNKWTEFITCEKYKKYF